MEVYLLVAASFLTACHAIISQPRGCVGSLDGCAPRVITSCPSKPPIEACPTCCCDSSENVEFYDPDRPEPWCSAPPAVYTVKFVGTWTLVCNPDYYFSSAHWSPPTGVSHTTDYQMWDACMENVSPGVALVSQFGATGVIEREWEGNSTHILDTFKGSVIGGGGNVSSDLSVDKYHQWVSTISMLAPSRDRMVGVANLRLCDGIDWKRTVKVCSELFSTATRSDRVYPRMQRNSVQWNNCSFGYFEFTFKEYKNASQQIPSNCQQQTSDVYPAENRPNKCRTCCCKTSYNADFYHPDTAHGQICTATELAEYKVSLVPSISRACHSSYPFERGLENAYFSDILLTSHSGLQLFDSCEQVLPLVIRNLQSEMDAGVVQGFYLSPNVLERGQIKRRSAWIQLSPSRSFLTLLSKLLPSGSDNQWVGFTGLNLCGPHGWKDSVQVCLPLRAIANQSSETELQGNHCSFARAIIERRVPPVPPLPPSNCTLFNDKLPSNSILTTCCYHEFIIDGQILRAVASHVEDPYYKYTLVVSVLVVYYDDINHINVGDIININVCSLHSKIRFRRTYRLAGSRECRTNNLIISDTGILAILPRRGIVTELCSAHISGGNCDDPR